ncbi:MAG: hypothetical protein HY403_03790 [Elusimicrobia bacterium]|nr:hypothetical protein [Elusimicrobiota bacterium]
MKDDELWEAMRVLAAEERPVVAIVVEHLAEVDRRALYTDRGYRSLYDYCVYSLKYPEGAAYRRIRAARAVIKRPELLNELISGSISLETLTLLHPHLDAPHFDDLLLRAKGRTTREVEMIVAEYQPAVRTQDVMRFVGMETATSLMGTAQSAYGTGSRNEQTALAGVRVAAEAGDGVKKLVRFAFTADEELYNMVRRSQQLMRHKYPDGRLEGIFRDALKLLIEEKDMGLKSAKAAERKARRHAAKARRA